MRPLHILLIVFNQVGKGTYWRALHFGRCLAARGHTVTLLATAPRARAAVRTRVVDGVQLVEMPDLQSGALRSGWDPWAVVRRLAWLRERRFDIVHAFEARPVVIYPALAAQRAGARLVMDWCDWFGRGGSVEERPNPLVRAVLRPVETYYEDHFRARAAATTVINRFLGERAAALGVPRQSILLLRNGARHAVPLMDRVAARRAVGLPEAGPLLAYVGGAYTADARLMAQALNALRRQAPEARLVLIGFNRDLEQWLDDPGAVIRFPTMPQEHVYPYLAAGDICWLPLNDTGANRGRWPLKLSDYMTVGRPTVATNVGDLPEVVEQYRLGLTTPPDPQALAAATFGLLRDDDRMRAFGEAARRAAEGDFSWPRLAERLEAHYRQTLER